MKENLLKLGKINEQIQELEGQKNYTCKRYSIM